MLENEKKQNGISEIVSSFEDIYKKMNVNEKIEFLNTIIKTVETDVKIEKRKVLNKSEINIVNVIFK